MRGNSDMLRVAIIVGSTRPGRKGDAVARWVYEIAGSRVDAEFELVDIKEYDLPLLDEPISAIFGQYSNDHTKAWSAKIASFDAFLFVTPEYNHATSGALKNAIDYLYKEWNNKAAGFVGYGGAGRTRAVENLRLLMGEWCSPAFAPQWRSRSPPTSRTSASSSRHHIRRRRFTTC